MVVTSNLSIESLKRVSAPQSARLPAKVSVVIPAYKAAQTICRAVDSVIGQTVPAFEIIVVDDGSPDDVAQVVATAYGDRVVLVRQPNAGAAIARNAGIDRATGEFVAFLDADDYWEPDRLAAQLAVFERYPEVGLVAGGYFVQQPGQARMDAGIVPARWRDCVISPRGATAFEAATVAWTGSVIVRRELLATDRFVSGLEPAEDRDLWFRLMNGRSVYFVSRPLATGVQEPGSLSRSSVDRDCSHFLAVIDRHRKSLGWLAYRQWTAHTYYRWSASDNCPATSVPRLLRSFCVWPLPFARTEQCRVFGRVKRLIFLSLAAARS